MRLLTLIRRRDLAYELLDEHDSAEMEYLTRDPATAWEAINRWAALRDSKTPAERRGSAERWIAAVERAARHYPE